MNDTVNYPRLLLNTFLWEKLDTEEVLEFNSGLNILHGKTQADRTILLRLMRYALGGSFERIDSKILEASIRVILKISANGENITFIRSCQQPNAKLDIEDKDGKRSLSIQETSPYLLEKLGLPQVVTKTTDRDGGKQDRPLSFNDLARAFVVDRDISYSAIMAGVYERPFIEIARIMFGLTTQEIADTENAIRRKEADILDLRQSITSIQTFLKRLDVPTLIEIESRRNGILEGLARLNQEEQELRQNVRASIGGEVSTYEPAKNELLNKRKELEEKQRELLNLLDQKREKLELKSLLSEEVKRLERHISSHYVISTFTFTICPRCSQEVTSEMQHRESEGLCSLCGRSLVEHNDTEAWEKSIRDTKQSIKEVDILIMDHDKRIDQLQKDVKPLGSQIEDLEKKLERETSQYVSPIIEHLGLIVSASSLSERTVFLRNKKQKRL